MKLFRGDVVQTRKWLQGELACAVRDFAPALKTVSLEVLNDFDDAQPVLCLWLTVALCDVFLRPCIKLCFALNRCNFASVCLWWHRVVSVERRSWRCIKLAFHC